MESVILAAGILMPVQFVPVVRRRYVRLHRYLGRLLLILLMFGNICKESLGMINRCYLL